MVDGESKRKGNNQETAYKRYALMTSPPKTCYYLFIHIFIYFKFLRSNCILNAADFLSLTTAFCGFGLFPPLAREGR